MYIILEVLKYCNCITIITYAKNVNYLHINFFEINVNAEILILGGNLQYNKNKNCYSF